MAWAAWVVWTSESNRSEHNNKKRPGSNAWPFYLDDDSCMEVTALRGSSGHLNDADFQE